MRQGFIANALLPRASDPRRQAPLLLGECSCKARWQSKGVRRLTKHHSIKSDTAEMQGGSRRSKKSKQDKQASSFIWPEATAKICDREDEAFVAQPSYCRLVLSHNDSCAGAMNLA